MRPASALAPTAADAKLRGKRVFRHHSHLDDSVADGRDPEIASACEHCARAASGEPGRSAAAAAVDTPSAALTHRATCTVAVSPGGAPCSPRRGARGHRSRARRDVPTHGAARHRAFAAWPCWAGIWTCASRAATPSRRTTRAATGTAPKCQSLTQARLVASEEGPDVGRPGFENETLARTDSNTMGLSQLAQPGPRLTEPEAGHGLALNEVARSQSAANHALKHYGSLGLSCAPSTVEAGAAAPSPAWSLRPRLRKAQVPQSVAPLPQLVHADRPSRSIS